MAPQKPRAPRATAPKAIEFDDLPPLIEQAGDDTELELYGWLDQEGRYGYIARIPHDTDKDRIRATYGPGRYQIKMRSGGRFTGSAVVEIAQWQGTQQRNAAPDTVAPPGPGGGDRMFEILIAQMNNSATMMAAALQRPEPTPPANDLTGMAALLEVVAGTKGKSGATPTLAETIEAIAKMREMASADGGTGSPGTSPAQWVDLARATVSELSSQRQQEAAHWKMQAQVAAAQLRKAQLPGPAPKEDGTPGQQMGFVPERPDPATPAPAMHPLEPLALVLESGAATEDADASAYAEVVLNAMEGAGMDPANFPGGAMTDYLCEQIPRLERYREFLLAVDSIMRQMLDDSAPGAPEVAGTPGQQQLPPSHSGEEPE